jgi:SAM-dependent methyltransferase
MLGSADYWDMVYTTTPVAELCWFEPIPGLSIELIARHAPRRAGVVDIGGGASHLAALAHSGHSRLAVVDISAEALKLNRAKLGAAARRVRWIAADITRWRPDARWPVWHDRAVFHLMTSLEDQKAYVARLTAGLAPNGTLILATYARGGPTRCSGLPVQRYTPDRLAARLDALAPGRFVPLAAQPYTHRTPAGDAQAFQYSVFRHNA